MKFSIEEQSGVSILGISGIITAPCSMDLFSEVKGLVADGKNQIILDLSGVERLDSTAIGTLVASLTHVHNTGGELVLTRIPEQFDPLIKLIKLERIFKIFPDRQSAVAAF